MLSAGGARRQEIMTVAPVHHPAVQSMLTIRYQQVQLRIADRITAFAGSMWFVYIHAVGFGVWMLFFEKSPWPTLTLVVSLEAIFLSTFVMIGQNRQAAFQQAKADHDFVEEELELKRNTTITQEVATLTKQIHELTTEVRDRLAAEKT
jgi:uncharacterized membrane protein